jgi:hypothetical protein
MYITRLSSEEWYEYLLIHVIKINDNNVNLD